MEAWDILDKTGEPTGKIIRRGKDRLSKGEFHLVVHIWILNKKGEYLIQRRSETKNFMPGEWAATGGAAISGELSRLAACRELYEELSIHVSSHKLVLIDRLVRKNSIADLWGIVCDIDINNLTLQKDEVAEVKWVSRKTLKQMIEKGQFHNYGTEYFNSLFQFNF